MNEPGSTHLSPFIYNWSWISYELPYCLKCCKRNSIWHKVRMGCFIIRFSQSIIPSQTLFSIVCLACADQSGRMRINTFIGLWISKRMLSNCSAWRNQISMGLNHLLSYGQVVHQTYEECGSDSRWMEFLVLHCCHGRSCGNQVFI